MGFNFSVSLYSFFTVPSNAETRLLWVQALGIEDVFHPTLEFQNSIICHAHFESSQYKICRKLIPNALPSIQEPVRPPVLDTENLTPLAETTPRRVLEEIGNTVKRTLWSNVVTEQETLKRKNAKISEKNMEIKSIRSSAFQLQNKLDAQTISPEMIKNAFQESKSMIAFIEMQVRRYESEKNGHYTAEEKTIAITLFYSCGRNGYRTIQNLGFILPSLSTLRRWLCKLTFLPGRNPDVLECLSKISLMNPKELDCMITLDETSVTKAIVYNRHTDAFEGFQTHGDLQSVKMKPADHALVVIVRFLTTNLKMPLAYYFNAKGTTSKDLKTILWNSIADVKAVGAKVRAIVTDQGGPNQGLAKLLNISIENPFFLYEEEKVYFLNDAPHIAKCLRNNLMNHNYILNKGSSDEKHVKWEHIQNVYDKDKMLTVRSCPKLTLQHFELNHLDKMKVKWAVQIFSKSVAAGIRLMVEKKMVPEEYSHTADFAEKIDEIFDLLNISCDHIPGKPIKSAKNLYKNLDKILEYKQWVSTIKSADGVHVPTIKGLQITLGAIHSLVTDLQTEGYKYVLTRRLQSDCVEHFSL